MKKLYYYCKSKQNFVEIKNYKSKIFTYFAFFGITISGLFIGGSFLISSFTSFNPEISKIKEENEYLKAKLSEIAGSYESLNNDLEKLRKENNDLRLAVNLPLISEDERNVGVGGGYFDNLLDFNTDKDVSKVLAYVDEVTRKIKFEKSNYLEITNKLKENKRLYSSLPAIKPSAGTLAAHGFGMREHPILNITKMHEGIDIITDIGTPVYASGDGVVDFVGKAGGYGLTIEIDHGFGYRSVYAHLSKTTVKKGQRVTRGALIAKTGNSGLSSGPHLHYEVHHNGIKMDPQEFFFDGFNFVELRSKNN